MQKSQIALQQSEGAEEMAKEFSFERRETYLTGSFENNQAIECPTVQEC